MNAQITNTFPDSGNVGIGTITPSPSYKLDVLGTGRFTGTLQANNGIFVSNNKLLAFSSYNYFDFYIGSDANKDALHIGYGNTLGSYNQMTFDQTTNRIGIYNSSPSYTLDVTGTGRFTSNLLIGDPNGARTEINTSTNHKIFAPTNIKTIDLDGNYHGGGYVGVYRSDIQKRAVAMLSHTEYNYNSLIVYELRGDEAQVEAINLSSFRLNNDLQPNNIMTMPSLKSTIIVGDNYNYKIGQGYGLINKLKTSFENDVYVETGNVGIGTTTPAAKLDVENGDLYVGEEVSSNGNRREIRIYGFDNGVKHYGSLHSNYDESKRTFDINTSNDVQQIKIDASANSTANILLNPGISGKVGIGTTTPDSKLTVAGNIHAREVKVTISAGADFVFHDDYNLPKLEEVEQFIKENKHLPEIASEKEMKDNGLLLAEMNIKLLQKIEELTLYTIEQQKLIEKQSEALENQFKMIKELQESIKMK
ncbi:tail fiber protein [Mariniflexile rhizosphaerae]|uniref:tail fiber protein n=1 Tax=unclassified Mariniflexile TaxID=2643887 RepID=UPI000CAA3384|nr:tail fiber protein [Mariniflexile sp. TRM1-10]PLB17862.1 MAG: hypothetical protein TRG1_3312 [Flavobacteriaceae bacterium FS1-H7996/R]